MNNPKWKDEKLECNAVQNGAGFVLKVKNRRYYYF